MKSISHLSYYHPWAPVQKRFSRRDASRKMSLNRWSLLEGGWCHEKTVFLCDSALETHLFRRVSRSSVFSQLCRSPFNCWCLWFSRCYPSEAANWRHRRPPLRGGNVLMPMARMECVVTVERVTALDIFVCSSCSWGRGPQRATFEIVILAPSSNEAPVIKAALNELGPLA